MQTKQQIHELVDRLPESETGAAARRLEFLLSHDEAPVDPEMLKRIDAARARNSLLHGGSGRGPPGKGNPGYNPCMPHILTIDSSILRAALIGYQRQRDEIDAKIAEIRRQIGGQTPQASAPEGDAPAKRAVGAAGRKRMAAAQRKRWAEFKKAKEAPAPAKKRRLSAAGRKRIIDATKKRWADVRAKKAAAHKGQAS